MAQIERPKTERPETADAPGRAVATPGAPPPDRSVENRTVALRLLGVAGLMLALAIGVAVMVLYVEATYAPPKP